jgi:HlyD family secretion protein
LKTRKIADRAAVSIGIMNRKKSLIAVVLVLILGTAALLVYRTAFARETTSYRFVAIERGDIKATVSATGKLNALKTVSVGTQVSGQVSELLVDFNDRVKKGQLLARIDPTLAMQSVTDAQANVERVQAQLLESQRQYARNRELAASGLVARSEVESTQSSNAVAQATLKSARVALQRAQQNLSYTNIYAPIDGVVVERNVDEGQTVAASLSAPQLFMIANDLSQMQILAEVAESDIAQIKEGQPVDFSVQALPGQTFKGTVQQVRLQSATQENVVNYTVVVSVQNPERKLLPGMTARVEFLTQNRPDVLKVASSALRFRPTDEQLAELKAARQQATSTATATTTAARSARTQNGARTGNGSSGALYYVDAAGKLKVARVRTGITDGTTTEVTGKDIKEGMRVIAGTGAATAQTAAKSATASPFQSGQSGQQSQQRRAPGGF